MEWVELRLEVPEDVTESVSNVLHEHGAGGVVFDDPTFINKYVNEKDNKIWDYCAVEEVEWTGRVILTAYFHSDDSWMERYESIVENIDEAIIAFGSSWDKQSLKSRIVNDSDWENEWKNYFHTQKLGEKFILKPSWEELTEQADDAVVLEIDPGMAFGSGTHETTKMCVELLENVIKKGDLVWDVGTGSGILAIACAKLGASRVEAVDNDVVAVAVAQENIRINDVQNIVSVRKGDLLKGFNAEQPAIIVANIIADIIIKMLPAASALQEDGSMFLASGIIQDRFADVREAMVEYGYEIRESKNEGLWVAILAVKHKR